MAENAFAPVTPGEILKDEFLTELTSSRASAIAVMRASTVLAAAFRSRALSLATTTFVAALRVGQIAAPCVFNGPMDGPSFRAYVGQFVVPILRRGDIVVMDNLPSHKVAGIRDSLPKFGVHPGKFRG